MGKCKEGTGECGKDICCMDCEDRSSCDFACSEQQGCSFYVNTEVTTLDQQVPDVIKAISDITVQKKALEEQEKIMREKLQAAMEQFGVKSFDNEFIRVTYVAATTRTNIDSTKLKKEHPEIAKAYQKVSNVKASVKIEVK